MKGGIVLGKKLFINKDYRVNEKSAFCSGIIGRLVGYDYVNNRATIVTDTNTEITLGSECLDLLWLINFMNYYGLRKVKSIWEKEQ